MDPIVEIPPFRLDRERGLLLQGPREIRLRRRTWEVLLHLVAHAGRVVPKQALMRAVWAGVVVSDQTLSTSISELRRALGDDAREPRFIETVHGRGFRFLLSPIGADAARSGRSGSIETARVGFVGRSEPLSALGRALERAASGHRQLVLVRGESGVGKTTLVEAFAAGLPVSIEDGSDGVAIRIVKTEGQCVEFTGSGEACMPVIAALRLLTRGPEARRAIATIRRLVPRWMAVVLGAEDDTGAPAIDPGRESRTRTLRLLVETLEELARDVAMLVLIEDLHWSDPSTLELLDLLARRGNPTRLLVVATLRDDETSSQADGLDPRLRDLVRKGLATTIDLAGFDDEEVRALAESRLGSAEVPPSLVAHLRRSTDGNPFLLGELLEGLRRDGRLDPSERGGTPDDATVRDPESLPPSVRAAVEARVGILSAPERAAVEIAAVFGLAFDLEAVAIVAAREPDGLDLEGIEALCHRLRGHGGMLVGPLDRDASGTSPPAAGSGLFGFRHALFAEVLRTAIPSSRRRRIHRMLGAWYADHASRPDSVGAHHFEQGEEWSRALDLYSAAAREAKRRQADPEAIGLYRSALRCLEALPPSSDRDERELALRVELGGSILGVSGYTDPEIVPIHLRIRTLARQLDRPVMNMVATGGLFFASMSSGRIEDGHAEARRLMEAARALPPVFQRIARCALGVAVFSLGHLAEARALLEDASGSEAWDGVSYDVHVPVLGLGALATVHAQLGDLRRGREALEATLATGRSTGRAYDLANAHRLAAEYGAAVGDVALARAQAEATIALADEYGFGQLGSIGRIFVAWADARDGTPRKALLALRDAIEDLDQRGYRLMRSTFCARWAEAALEAAQTALALEVVDAGLRHVATSGEVRHESDLWRLRAAALRQLGDPDRDAEAAAAIDRALQVARSQGANLFVLRALVERARWTRSDRGAAREALRAFVAGAPAEMAGPDLAEARTLLAG